MVPPSMQLLKPEAYVFLLTYHFPSTIIANSYQVLFMSCPKHPSSSSCFLSLHSTTLVQATENSFGLIQWSSTWLNSIYPDSNLFFMLKLEWSFQIMELIILPPSMHSTWVSQCLPIYSENQDENMWLDPDGHTWPASYFSGCISYSAKL